MGCPRLKKANRELLRAIETPPDTGREESLDEIAAEIWAFVKQRREPDPDRLYRLTTTIKTIERNAPSHRANHIRQARYFLRRYLAIAGPENFQSVD